MTKTISSRIPKDLHDKLRERCNQEGCNTNDFIRDILESELEQNSQDQEVIEDTKPEPKPKEPQKIIITDIPEPKATVELIPTPKITIKEVIQDNSNKPVVQFTQFNGKLLPSAKRYNL
ncbi:MAG: hypothetical protein IH841_09190 [Thaumarchaeota archaeon]|nr:hypothetical protein [Nitrososphaerota archaeon]